jgi:transglutaminase-like putative cysteine protease
MLARLPNSLRLNIPDGAAGTRETLKHMRELVRQGKSDIAVRDVAARVVSAVPAKDWEGELCALFEFVRSAVRYTLDPNDIETIQGAAATLNMGYGDCDDFAVLLATLCECVGHPCCLAALGFESAGDYSHVLVIASGAGELPWIAMDPTEPYPFGWFPKGVVCEMLAPIGEAAAHALERFR